MLFVAGGSLLLLINERSLGVRRLIRTTAQFVSAHSLKDKRLTGLVATFAQGGITKIARRQLLTVIGGVALIHAPHDNCA